MSAETKQPAVKVGQIWQDCDKRMGNRQMRVVEIDGDYAHLEDKWFRTRIAIRRMRPTSTGWRLIQDVTEQAANQRKG